MKRLLVVLALSLGFAAAQDAAPTPRGFANLLPAETLLFMEVDDLGGWEQWKTNTALGRIWSEPEVQHFVQGLWNNVRAAIAQLQGGMDVLAMVGLEKSDIEGIAIRNFGLAVVDVRMSDAGPQLDAVVALDFRSGGAKAEKIMGALRNALGTFVGVGFTEVEMAGRKVYTTAIPGHVVHLFAGEDRILVTTQRERMTQLLAAVDGKHGNTLAAAPRFTNLRRRMGADKYAELVYLDVPRAYQRALQIGGALEGRGAARDIAQFTTASGLDGVEAIGFAEIPSGTGYRTELAFTLREQRGIFSLAQKGRPTHRFADYVPSDAMVYAAESFDAAIFWDKLVAFAERVQLGAGADMQEELGQLNEFLGIDLQKDILAAVGPEWAAYVSQPPGGGIIPDLVLFADVRDRARFVQAIDRVLARLQDMAPQLGFQVARNKAVHRGVTIHFLELAERRGDPIPIAPAWVIGEDYVACALVPQTLKHALAKKDSIRAKREFAVLEQQIPETANSVSYLDVRTIVNWVYNSAVPVLQVVQGAINQEIGVYGVRINLQDLPPAEVVVRHLSDAVFYSALEDGAYRMGYVSSFGAPLIVVPAVAVGFVTFLAIGGEREARVREAHREHTERRRVEVETAKLRAQLKAAQAQLDKTQTVNKNLVARLDALEKQLAELKKAIEESKAK